MIRSPQARRPRLTRRTSDGLLYACSHLLAFFLLIISPSSVFSLGEGGGVRIGVVCIYSVGVEFVYSMFCVGVWGFSLGGVCW